MRRKNKKSGLPLDIVKKCMDELPNFILTIFHGRAVEDLLPNEKIEFIVSLLTQKRWIELQQSRENPRKLNSIREFADRIRLNATNPQFSEIVSPVLLGLGFNHDEVRLVCPGLAEEENASFFKVENNEDVGSNNTPVAVPVEAIAGN